MATILLVEDDDQYRAMLNEVLRLAGHEVFLARNGNEALRLYQAQPADVVLTDLIMPEKEGLETIRELRALNPAVKIIAMSGGGRINSKDYLLMAQRFKAQRVLAKPFLQQTLLTMIRELLEDPTS
jgi:CheY-like chemotaxis protein